MLARPLSPGTSSEFAARQVEAWRLLRAFAPDYHLDGDAVTEAIRTGTSVNAIHFRSSVKVDRLGIRVLLDRAFAGAPR